MHLCMRTTIDIPDSLLDRVKQVLQKRKTTFRSIVISALEKALEEDATPFVLRDASVGVDQGAVAKTVSVKEINRHIDELRDPALRD